MTKTELVRSISEKAGLTLKGSAAALEGVMDTISDALASGEDVTLTGFGNFVVRDRAARKGKNPQNGQEIDIPASKAPGFKPGKALKDRVNNR